MNNKSCFQNTATIILPFNVNKLAQPNVENKASAGTIIYSRNEPAIVLHRIDLPFIGPQDGAVDIIGDSMAPTYPHGCIVGICRMADQKLLHYGECYVIVDTNFQPIVRRVYQHKMRWDRVQLVCDNEDQDRFPPCARDWDQIKAIFRITSIIIKL